MRQGQNNSKRSRGRGGRKPQHSTNRAYDSNGPDVKIRGNAAHICEKYQQLARDAISAGDRIAAENYYQHAEHYYRLLLAAQQGQEGQQRPQTNLAYRPDEDEENENDFAPDGPQPRHPGQPWHQQGGNNGNNGGGQNGHAGNGQANGTGNEAASDEEGEDAPEASTSDTSAQGAEGEGGQPRRRSNRRRRPRAEGARADATPAESGAE
ncbi:MAG: DUF4167 domain-containing protein [Parvibaculum sp.]|nr:DUF4167 domain-containing protein [Parvibaculum sp.]